VLQPEELLAVVEPDVPGKGKTLDTSSFSLTAFWQIGFWTAAHIRFVFASATQHQQCTDHQ
jgi:hypothetical protein